MGETQIAKIVRNFRKEMAQRNATFFLLYSDIHLDSNKIIVKLTTNSTVEGVSSILGTVLEPTDKARALLEEAFAQYHNDPIDVTERAAAILEKVCTLLTVKNIEPGPPTPEIKA